VYCLGLALLLALCGYAAPALATFHLWHVSEVFSNADGSIQFIEFFTTSGGQQFLGGGARFVRTEQANVTRNSFTFPADLVVPPLSTTANHHFLVATPGFHAVAGITPDFEIPAGFIEVGIADEINYANFASFVLAGLPTDGVNSLNEAAVIAAATPTNFAGSTGTIVPEPGVGLSGIAAVACLAASRRRGAPRSG
jgi:serralysin